MIDFELTSRPDALRFKNIYGVFVSSQDDVQFRIGSMSGPSIVLSDPERRGLLGAIVGRLLSLEPALLRQWNEAELELLNEIIPQLQQEGIIEYDRGAQRSGEDEATPKLSFKALENSRIAIVGHGVLGQAVRSLLVGMPCQSITTIESSSVPRRRERGKTNEDRRPAFEVHGSAALCETRTRPQNRARWIETIKDHDWIIAAQDCFEPEELSALGKAARALSVPWSLVCFDGYEGWVGPTFVPGETACFECFRRRLLASAGEPKHVFMDPGTKVYRVPSPWSVGPSTDAWISLVTSMFALELIAAFQGRGFTLNNMLIVHRLNLTFQREAVLRLPRCPECAPRAGGPAMNVFSNLLATRKKDGS